MSKQTYHVAITPECHSYTKNKSSAHDVTKRMHQDGVLTIQLVPALNETKDNQSDNQIQLKPKQKTKKTKTLWDLFKQ